MKRWPMFLVYLLEIVVVVTAIYYEPTWCVRGKLWGEAFYNSKPTSWWRQELGHWEIQKTNAHYGWRGRLDTNSYSRNATWFELVHERCAPRSAWDKLEADLTEMAGPRILDGEVAAEPVLRGLLNDPSPNVRRFARIGLKMDPEKED